MFPWSVNCYYIFNETRNFFINMANKYSRIAEKSSNLALTDVTRINFFEVARAASFFLKC